MGMWIFLFPRIFAPMGLGRRPGKLLSPKAAAKSRYAPSGTAEISSGFRCPETRQQRSRLTSGLKNRELQENHHREPKHHHQDHEGKHRFLLFFPLFHFQSSFSARPRPGRHHPGNARECLLTHPAPCSGCSTAGKCRDSSHPREGKAIFGRKKTATRSLRFG
jgi:hypothetical protein